MRHVSLFSGVGGFDVAFKKAGHELIMMCESDPGCQQLLKSRFPGVPLVPDITMLLELPAGTEIVSAGFPCIDLSRAGLRAGIQAGQSSGLVRHVFRLLDGAIRRQRPVPWVVFENVEGVLDHPTGAEGAGGQPAIDLLVSALEALGYGTWSYRIVASACTGLPNRRRRLFLVAAWSADSRDVLLSQGPMKCQGGCEQAAGEGEEGCFECYDPVELVNIAMDLGNARSAPALELVPTFTTTNRRICLLLATGDMGMLRIEDAERLQGFPEGWTEPMTAASTSRAEDATERAADAAAAARYRAMANAVTVPVAEWIGRRLTRPHAHRFLGSPSDTPLGEGAQTQEAVDACTCDGDPGPWEDGKHGLLLGPTTAQMHACAQPGHGLWQRADLAVCAAQHLELQSQEVAVEEALRQQQEAPACGSAVPGANDAAGPSHGGYRDARGASSAPATDDDAEEAAGSGQKDPAAAVVGVGAWKEARKCAATTCARIAATSDAGQRVTKRQHEAPPAQAARRAAWPRAAWWVRGGLRFSTSCCDAPLKARLCPLHDFIHTLAPMPPLAQLHTYISRLKEQGWNVWRMVKKAVDAGRLHSDLAPLLQMPEQRSTSKESIGWLVFAPFLPEHPSVRWPAEAVDPLHPPKGRKVPPEAFKALSKEDQGTLKHTMQQLSRAGAPHSPLAAADAPQQQQLQEVALNLAASNQPLNNSVGGAEVCKGPTGANRAGKGRGKGGSGGRRMQALRTARPHKVLVNLFATHKLLWMDRSELCSFDEHREEECDKAEQLKAACKLPHARLYAKAMDIADSYLAVQKGVKGSAGEAAKAQTAADAAAQINSMPPCGKCEACIANMTSSVRRRCLHVRAYAAAAGGHTGAQVAVLESKALGARVEVWWAQEEQWFTGTVSAYHGLNMRHTISYDDGDVEIVPLWAPNQMIKLRNSRDQFPAALSELREAKDAATAEAAQHKEALLNGARMAPDAGGPENELERARHEQMRRNLDMLKTMVPDARPEATSATHAAASPAAAASTKKEPAAKLSTPKRGAAGAMQAPHTPSEQLLVAAEPASGRSSGCSTLMPASEKSSKSKQSSAAPQGMDQAQASADAAAGVRPAPMPAAPLPGCAPPPRAQAVGCKPAVGPIAEDPQVLRPGSASPELPVYPADDVAAAGHAPSVLKGSKVVASSQCTSMAPVQQVRVHSKVRLSPVPPRVMIPPILSSSPCSALGSRPEASPAVCMAQAQHAAAILHPPVVPSPNQPASTMHGLQRPAAAAAAQGPAAHATQRAPHGSAVDGAGAVGDGRGKRPRRATVGQQGLMKAASKRCCEGAC